jgi:hypothetical protein
MRGWERREGEDKGERRGEREKIRSEEYSI